MAASWSLQVHKTRPPEPVAAGTVIPLSGEVVVGRGADADLVLTDDRISRRHARLVVREDGLWVEPLGRGAVYVDREPVGVETRLGEGAWLQLGGVLFRVQARSGPAVLTVQADEQRAWLGGRVLELRPSEFRLLRALAERPGQWVASETLAQAVWEDDPSTANPAYINKYVSYLRRALRDALHADDRLCRSVTEAVGAGLEAGETPEADPDKLPLQLVKARKKVGFRLQLSGGQIALI